MWLNRKESRYQAETNVRLKKNNSPPETFVFVTDEEECEPTYTGIRQIFNEFGDSNDRASFDML